MGFDRELEDIFRQHEENQYWEKVRIQAAIAAMQGYIDSGAATAQTFQDVAKWSVKQADALIEELKKKK